MRVAFLFLHPFAGSLGSTVRVRELTTHLNTLRVQSFILTPYENNQVLNEGVNVISVGGTFHKLGLAKYFYRLTKLAYYNSFFIKHFMTSKMIQSKFAKNNASSIVRALKRNPVEIIQVEQDFAIPTAIEVKKKTGLPLIADLHNITSEELVASGAINANSAEFRKLQDMLRNNLAEVDAVVVVSDLMKVYVVKNYALPSEKVHVVQPGADPVESAKNVSDHPKVVYSGLVSYREHIDLFVKSMPFIKEKIKDVEFYITDKGENLKKIKNLAKQLGVDPVFFWYPKKEDFTNFLSSCDVAVLPSSNDLARQMGTPVKLFDYLSVGLPVVANDIGAWTNIIQKENVGAVTGDEPECFAAAIVKLLENLEFRAECSNNAKRIADTSYTWDNSAQTLLSIYRNSIA